MPITIQNDEGQDMEVYTADELQAQKVAAAEEAVKPITEEYTKLQKIHADQAQNFKLLKNMTEEEKNKLSVSEIEQRKIAEKALEDNAALTARLDEKEKSEADQKREAAIRAYTGDDKDMRAKVEAHLEHLTIPDIAERVAAAATLAGIKVESINPLNQPMSGQPPMQRKEDEATQKDEFFKSEKGKAAQAMIDQLG